MTELRTARRLAMPVAITLALASSFALHAQDAPKTLEVITVTAEKRGEDVQKVPESITTIDTEKLDEIKAGGDDIRFISARVPSLLVESSFGRTFPRFYIRGLGNTDFDLNASQIEVPGTKDVLLPAWSPDGTKIVYLQKTGRHDYAVMSVGVTHQ